MRSAPVLIECSRRRTWYLYWLVSGRTIVAGCYGTNTGEFDECFSFCDECEDEGIMMIVE